MGIGDFLDYAARAGGKLAPREQRTNPRSVRSFSRGQLENASKALDEGGDGFVSSFFDNLGTLGRAPGVAAAGIVDTVFGEDSTMKATQAARAVSKKVKDSRIGSLTRSLFDYMPVAVNPMSLVDAPSGDFRNSAMGKGIGSYKDLYSKAMGVDPGYEESYLTDKFKQRVREAEVDSGFLDTAATIAANRRGQKQDNLVESTLGKAPLIGPMFNKYTPTVQSEAERGGADPMQAAFMSMAFNPLEWATAESKIGLAGKFRNFAPGSKFLSKVPLGPGRLAFNEAAQKVVDPIQALFDAGQSAKAYQAANAADEAARSKSVEQLVGDFLGQDPNATPIEALDKTLTRPVAAIDEAVPAPRVAEEPLEVEPKFSFLDQFDDVAKTDEVAPAQAARTEDSLALSDAQDAAGPMPSADPTPRTPASYAAWVDVDEDGLSENVRRVVALEKTFDRLGKLQKKLDKLSFDEGGANKVPKVKEQIDLLKKSVEDAFPDSEIGKLLNEFVSVERYRQQVLNGKVGVPDDLPPLNSQVDSILKKLPEDIAEAVSPDDLAPAAKGDLPDEMKNFDASEDQPVPKAEPVTEVPAKVAESATPAVADEVVEASVPASPNAAWRDVDAEGLSENQRRLRSVSERIDNLRSYLKEFDDIQAKGIRKSRKAAQRQEVLMKLAAMESNEIRKVFGPKAGDDILRVVDTLWERDKAMARRDRKRGPMVANADKALEEVFERLPEDIVAAVKPVDFAPPPKPVPMEVIEAERAAATVDPDDIVLPSGQKIRKFMRSSGSSFVHWDGPIEELDNTLVSQGAIKVGPDSWVKGPTLIQRGEAQFGKHKSLGLRFRSVDGVVDAEGHSSRTVKKDGTIILGDKVVDDVTLDRIKEVRRARDVEAGRQVIVPNTEPEAVVAKMTESEQAAAGRALSKADQAKMERLEALEKTLDQIQVSTFPPKVKARKEAEVRSMIEALKRDMAAPASPVGGGMKVMSGPFMVPSMDDLRAFLGRPKKGLEPPPSEVFEWRRRDASAPVVKEDDWANKSLIALLDEFIKEEGVKMYTGLPSFTARQMALLSAGFKHLVKRIGLDTAWTEGRAMFDRIFSSTRMGKVGEQLVEEARSRSEAFEVYSRALADAYSRVVRGDLAGILGRAHASNYNFDQNTKALVMGFMERKVVNGQPYDEAFLLGQGVPQDAIEVAKIVRREMDRTSDNLMADQFLLPREWFNRLNNEQREMVSKLAKTASKPVSRSKYLAWHASQLGQPGVPGSAFLAEAKKYVDDGYNELNRVGLWLPGEDPVDMMLDWAPYLRNRESYHPLLYRLFEHNVTSKGEDAVELYIDALRKKGVDLSPEVEGFLKTSWVRGGTRGNASMGAESQRLMKRNPNLPEEVKELIQEIDDPAYAFAKGLYQVNRLRAVLNTRRWLASQTQWVSRVGETLEEFAARTGHPVTDITHFNEYVFGPGGAGGKRLGAFAGRYIHNDYWELAYQVHALPGIHGRGTEAFLRFNREVIQRWKFWHTISNPTSHIHQAMQNFLAIWWAGGNRAIMNIGEARKAYLEHGDLYVKARRNGLLSGKSLADISEFIGDSDWKHLDFNAMESFIARLGKWGERMAMLSNSFRVGDESKKLSGKGAAHMWQYVDEIARMALLKTMLDRGINEKIAADFVKNEVYSGLGHARADKLISGVPFSSTYANPGNFTGLNTSSLRTLGIMGATAVGQTFNLPFFGVTKFLLKQTVRGLTARGPLGFDPGRMARSAIMLLGSYAMTEAWRQAADVSGKEDAQQRMDYMRGLMPMYARMTPAIMEMLDEDGKAGWVDYSWMFPYGELARGRFDAQSGVQSSTFLQGLAPQLGPVWKPVFEGFVFNSDTFRKELGMDDRIYHPGENKFRKAMAHVWRTWLPPWAPNPVFGVYDAMAYDGGADSHTTLKEAIRAFMQGVAMDSGHIASKAASGIYNSFDYWWPQNAERAEDALSVRDYAGRTQYFLKFVLDVLGVRIGSIAIRDIEARRSAARERGMAAAKSYWTGKISQTTNPEVQRQYQKQMREELARIKNGKPEPRWYDESWVDVKTNVLNAVARLKNRGTK